MLQVSRVAVKITSQQFAACAEVVADLAAFASRLRHAPLCAPPARPTDAARGWWRYVTGVVRLRVRQKQEEWSFRHMRESFADYREYAALHKIRVRAMIAASNSSSATAAPMIAPEIMTGLTRIERKYRAQLLLAWRQAAEEDMRLSDALLELAVERQLQREEADAKTLEEGADGMSGVGSSGSGGARHHRGTPRKSWFALLFAHSPPASPAPSEGPVHELRLRELTKQERSILIETLGYSPFSSPLPKRRKRSADGANGDTDTLDDTNGDADEGDDDEEAALDEEEQEAAAETRTSVEMHLGDASLTLSDEKSIAFAVASVNQFYLNGSSSLY